MKPIITETMPVAAELEALLDRLAAPLSDDDDAERIDLISSLESLKGACAAAQARLSVELDASQRREQAALGMPATAQGKGVASQIALARRDSPAKGNRHLGLAKALVREMPHTLHALAHGRISEWRATIMVRETATLSSEHRKRVDAALAQRLGSLGDRGLEREVRKLAYSLDPASALRRARGARSDRRVGIRPAPDTMTYLTGFLPAEQGVAVHAALSKHADTLRSGGDRRSRGQFMADTLVERVTGQKAAPATTIEVQLVVTDRTLWRGDSAPVHLSDCDASSWLGTRSAALPGVTLPSATQTTSSRTWTAGRPPHRTVRASAKRATTRRRRQGGRARRAALHVKGGATRCPSRHLPVTAISRRLPIRQAVRHSWRR